MARRHDTKIAQNPEWLELSTSQHFHHQNLHIITRRLFREDALSIIYIYVCVCVCVCRIMDIFVVFGEPGKIRVLFYLLSSFQVCIIGYHASHMVTVIN